MKKWTMYNEITFDKKNILYVFNFPWIPYFFWFFKLNKKYYILLFKTWEPFMALGHVDYRVNEFVEHVQMHTLQKIGNSIGKMSSQGILNVLANKEKKMLSIMI